MRLGHHEPSVAIQNYQRGRSASPGADEHPWIRFGFAGSGGRNKARSSSVEGLASHESVKSPHGMGRPPFLLLLRLNPTANLSMPFGLRSPLSERNSGTSGVPGWRPLESRFGPPRLGVPNCGAPKADTAPRERNSSDAMSRNRTAPHPSGPPAFAPAEEACRDQLPLHDRSTAPQATWEERPARPPKASRDSSCRDDSPAAVVGLARRQQRQVLAMGHVAPSGTQIMAVTLR